jgi:hypothetical protein
MLLQCVHAFATWTARSRPHIAPVRHCWEGGRKCEGKSPEFCALSITKLHRKRLSFGIRPYRSCAEVRLAQKSQNLARGGSSPGQFHADDSTTAPLSRTRDIMEHSMRIQATPPVNNPTFDRPPSHIPAERARPSMTATSPPPMNATTGATPSPVDTTYLAIPDLDHRASSNTSLGDITRSLEHLKSTVLGMQQTLTDAPEEGAFHVSVCDCMLSSRTCVKVARLVPSCCHTAKGRLNESAWAGLEVS